MTERITDTPAVDLRRRLLDQSIALIESDGLSALSLREVARRSGVSHQAPYHYFADREAVLAALVAEGFDGLADRLSAGHAAARDLTEQVELVGRAYIEFGLDHPAHFRLMFRPELVDSERYPDCARAVARANAELDRLVEAVAATPGGATLPAASLKLILWSQVHGMVTLMLDGPAMTKFAALGTAAEIVRMTTRSRAEIFVAGLQAASGSAGA